MAAPQLFAQQGLRIAVQGCGHGVLNDIYSSVRKACEVKGWSGVDLLIIGGDFQAVRNACDLKAISMPSKYYSMQDFHEYYSGSRTAPYLTIFTGGNHEASNYLWELYYGGWVAPKIYYMGAANVVRLGPLRIAGLSGIWKGYDYKKTHFERLPYNVDDVKTIYHVRELDVRKLLQIRTQIDVGLSHDWPRGMEWKGDFRQLFRFKPYFEDEAKEGTLGSVAAQLVLERLRPYHWFSAHMHARYTAVWEHKDSYNASTSQLTTGTQSAMIKNNDEIDLGIDDDTPAVIPKNEDEIELDLDDDDEVTEAPAAVPVKAAEPKTTDDDAVVSQALRAQLPASFAPPAPRFEPQTLPFPADITNKETRFLALDKCLANRHFLQLVEITPHFPADLQRPLKLGYDQEWLAITRVFAKDLQLGDPDARVPYNKGDGFYRPLIEQEMKWVEENVVKAGKMTIPEDFVRTAPVYNPSAGIHVKDSPREYTNPHTQNFCNLLQIPNGFDATDEERASRRQKGPRKAESWHGPGGGSRAGGNHRGGYGGGHGGGRGGGRGGRGNRGSRWWS